jgi:hypothetical protein
MKSVKGLLDRSSVIPNSLVIVYKRMIIHEFLAEYDETHPLVRAYVNYRVCLVNPFRCKIMHKKASFELLSMKPTQVGSPSNE